MKSPLDAALSDQPAAEAVLPEVETPASKDAGETPALREDAGAASAPESPERGPDGKFVAKAEEAGETPALRENPEASEAPRAPLPPSGRTPPASQGESGQVPISALLDEREQRQTAQKELKALQERLAQERADWQAKNPPTEAEVLEAQRYADNLRFSRRFAEKEYGKDFVQKAHDWAFAKCETDPLFNEQMKTSDDPYEAAAQAFNREEILRQVSLADLEAFNAWKAAQASAQPSGSSGEAARGEPPQPPASPAPPRSLATAPGNGAAGVTVLPLGGGEAYRSALG
ncbi:MAG TPA: hypothetical protein VGF71_14725 [Caulobacteraceae bacterium]|jgi:hypothetical protein